MGEDHGVHESNPLGNSGRGQCRESGKHIGSEENTSKQCRLDIEADIEPVSQNALEDKSPCKGIEGKKC